MLRWNCDQSSLDNGFKVKDLIRFEERKLEIDRYLPEYSYQKEPNGEWLCNSIHLLAQDEFKEFI